MATTALLGISDQVPHLLPTAIHDAPRTAIHDPLQGYISCVYINNVLI